MIHACSGRYRSLFEKADRAGSVIVLRMTRLMASFFGIVEREEKSEGGSSSF